ncbi:MAG: alkaline phosphatase D family protein [Chitinophagales bacterium]|nr:alkaline phosphatase D family protein [Chitinophagales bacterium]
MSANLSIASMASKSLSVNSLSRTIYLIVGCLAISFPLWAQQELQGIQQFPPNIYLDTAFAPFYYGVASGDPDTNRVMLWTRVSPTAQETVTLEWEIASDSLFSQLVNKGQIQATASTDWTVNIDADKLHAGGIYYYRFKSASGKYSQVGRARTLPTKSAQKVRLAIASCSSIYSGFFNAYRRIGERNDIDFMVHLGDYIYDFVDEDEEFRVPLPYPTEPNSLQEYRERHKYYLADPDLRYARQRQTWIAVWDNHDILSSTPEITEQAKQAFFEYLPIRKQNDPQEPYLIYRSFQLGNLAELFITDQDSYKQKGKKNGEKTVLGKKQLDWLKSGLSSSTATWHLIGSQKQMASWYSRGLPKGLPGDGYYFNPGDWDGFPEERAAILGHLKENNIQNNVVLSGDMHMSFAENIPLDPLDRKTYDRSTGKGSIAVEFLPTSISRGNFDEQGIPPAFIPTAQEISNSVNPHHVYTEFSKHGYGILDIRSERCVAEFWYVPKLEISSKQSFGVGLKVENGNDHWNWQLLAEPTQ